MRRSTLGGSGLDTSLDSLEGSTHRAFLDLTNAANAMGLTFTVRSTRRTCAQQADLYAVGRSGPSDTRTVVTHARGCVSWHVTGRAIDVTMTQGTYAELGALAKSMGWKWGGDFKGFPDVGHVEWHPGMTVEQICPDPLHCEDTDVDTTMPPGPDPSPPDPSPPADDSGDAPSSVVPFLLLGLVGVGALIWSRS